MATSVQMPALGESVTEGTVTRWLKQEGDTVEMDEPLLEVSTDKVDTEIPSPAAGVLKKIVAQEDDTVEVGGELAVIGDAGEDGGGGEEPKSEEPAEEQKPRSPPKRRSRPRSRPRNPSLPPRKKRNPSRGRARARGEACGVVGRRRRCHPGADARAGRVGHRGHGHPLAEEGRRQRRGGRAAGGGVHRQGRHRDPVAGRGHAVSASPPRRTTPSPSAASWPRSATPMRRPPKSPNPSRNPKRNRKRSPRKRPRRSRNPSPSPSRRKSRKPEPKEEAKPEPKPEPKEEPKKETKAAPQTDSEPSGDGAPYVTPLVRKLASENDIDLGSVKGSGVGGRIRKQDVLAAAEAKKAPAQEELPPRRRHPHPRRRQRNPRPRWPICAAPSRRPTGSGRSPRRRRANPCRRQRS